MIVMKMMEKIGIRIEIFFNIFFILCRIILNMDNLNSIYQSKLDGILGFEFLSPWLFSINYKKQKLYLHQLKVINP